MVSIRKRFEAQCLNAKKLEEVLYDTFSKAQRDILVNKKKKVISKSEDMSKAFTLRYLSKRCYLYLRNSLKYPLPHLSTLQKWAAKLHFRNGLLKDVLRFMEIAGMSLSTLEKLAVIQFDEMKVESVYEYDKTKDQIIGPHKQMQVIMVRGLFSNWKQPIFIDFDKKMTIEILNETIGAVHNVGYDVVACVSDCGGGYLGLWSSLNINFDNPYFLHPILEHTIFCFADVPHLLKLVRNWLLDTGSILEDGSINSQPLHSLLFHTSNSLSQINKKTFGMPRT